MASNLIPLQIAKCKKPYSIGEELVKPSLIALCNEVLCQSAASKMRHSIVEWYGWKASSPLWPEPRRYSSGAPCLRVKGATISHRLPHTHTLLACSSVYCSSNSNKYVTEIYVVLSKRIDTPQQIILGPSSFFWKYTRFVEHPHFALWLNLSADFSVFRSNRASHRWC